MGMYVSMCGSNRGRYHGNHCVWLHPSSDYLPGKNSIPRPCMFPQVTTFDCEQYYEIAITWDCTTMGWQNRGNSGPRPFLFIFKPRYLMSVMTM